MRFYFFGLLLCVSGFAMEPFGEVGYLRKSRVPEKAPEKRICVAVAVEYLAWFANQNGLVFPSDAAGDSPRLGAEWSSGVRVGLDVRPSNWDTKLAYTYYESANKDEVSTSIAGILAMVPSDAGIYEVSTNWKVNFNRVDWELGRKVFFGTDLVLRPFFGLEGLDVGQKLNLDTQAVFTNLTTGLTQTDVVVTKTGSTFLGLGTRAGFSANCALGAGFEFVGNLAGSVLWGRFTHLQYDSIFNCDLGIGFDWKYCFKKSQLLLQFGWEQHYFLDLIRLQPTLGNLTLSGFNLGAQVTY